MVYVLFAAITGGHLYDLVTRGEHWPFSSYPMYSHLNRQWTLEVPRVLGVREDGPSEEWLWRDELLAPFDQARLAQSLSTMRRAPDAHARLETALADCLRRYERRRRAGEHDGPPLSALRLYRTVWTLDLAAASLPHPTQQELLAATVGAGRR
jgi:hypothetical protein